MRPRILLQLVENRGALQLFAGAGALRVNGLPPCGSIFLIQKLGHWNRGKIRISKKLGPVKERPAECFDGEVNRLRRAVLQLREIVALQDVQGLDQYRAAGGGRRSADHVKSPIASAHRLALFDL